MKNTFKKITSIILAMFILMSISVTAFAAPGSGEYVGGSAIESEYIAWKIYNKYPNNYNPEPKMWEGDSLLYTDENGVNWRYFSNRNYIVCAEDNRWIYRILEDGTIAVCPSPDAEWTDLELVIPSKLDDKTVTILDMFSSMTGAISVIVPETVTELGFDCFRNTKVKRVVLGSNVAIISDRCFELTDDAEVYFCGTEDQWNDIIVYHMPDTTENTTWAVTGYNWLTNQYEGSNTRSYVSAIYFDVDPSALPPVEDLIEEEPVEPTIWDKIAQAFENFADSIVVFFEKVANFFANLFA